MPAEKLTTDALIALFEAKAAAPPPESSRMLVRHLQCKESLAASRCIALATDCYAGNDSQLLAAPKELLPPLG